VSNLIAVLVHAYSLLVFACIGGFAAYDLRTRRVPDKALLLFSPIALAAPFLDTLVSSLAADTFAVQGRPGACIGMALAVAPPEAAGASMSQFLQMLPPVLLHSLAGAATGFLILFAAAMASPGGCGVGGGDIKLAAAMGFAYGPSRMTAILLTASGGAAIAALIVSHRNKHTNIQKMLSLPFVPFLAAGSFLVTIAAIL
jgi:prepilin signal peptidase PulO-like enzyme (type II secretory pathway)